jgi:peptide deformylase
MALRPVLRFPNPTLRKKTVEVEGVTPEIRELVEDMVETMYAKRGVGLAAIQVGALERIFIVDAAIVHRGEELDEEEEKEEEEKPPIVFINPKIEWLSDEKETSDEGCLSFPGIYVPIERSLQARIRAFDLEGNEFAMEAKNLFARALQHEIDHLDNRLLIDHVGPLKRQSIKRKMDKMTDEEADDLQATGE